MDEQDNEIEMADVDDEDATERKVDLQRLAYFKFKSN
jgi:DNA-directed RNA polymerase subunit beta